MYKKTARPSFFYWEFMAERTVTVPVELLINNINLRGLNVGSVGKTISDSIERSLSGLRTSPTFLKNITSTSKSIQNLFGGQALKNAQDYSRAIGLVQKAFDATGRVADQRFAGVIDRVIIRTQERIKKLQGTINNVSSELKSQLKKTGTERSDGRIIFLTTQLETATRRQIASEQRLLTIRKAVSDSERGIQKGVQAGRQANLTSLNSYNRELQKLLRSNITDLTALETAQKRLGRAAAAGTTAGVISRRKDELRALATTAIPSNLADSEVQERKDFLRKRVRTEQRRQEQLKERRLLAAEAIKEQRRGEVAQQAAARSADRVNNQVAQKRYAEERRQAIESANTQTKASKAADAVNQRVANQRIKANEKFGKSLFTNLTAQTKQANNAFNSLVRSIQAGQVTAVKFGDAIGLALKRFGAFLIPSTGIFALVAGIRSGVTEALEFEKVMTRIQQVSGADRTGIGNISTNVLGAARGTGTKAIDIAQGLSTFAQAGFDDVKDLSKTAELLSQIPLAPSFDGIQETVEGLIAVFGQFNNTLSDSGHILDSVNQFAADFAVESKDLFEIIKRGGSTFSVGGGSLQDLLKFGTIVRGSTRESAETIGVFFKTATAELLSSKSRNILESQFGIKSDNITTIMQDLAKTFADRFGPDLGGAGAVTLAEELVGTRQLGKLLTLLRGLNDPKLTARFQDTLANLSGSLSRTANQRLDDIGISLARLREQFLSFFKAASDNEALRQTIKLLADLGEVISRVVSGAPNVLSLIGPLAAVVGGGAVKGVATGIKKRLFGDREGFDAAFVGGARSINQAAGSNQALIRARLSSGDISRREAVIRSKQIESQRFNDVAGLSQSFSAQRNGLFGRASSNSIFGATLRAVPPLLLPIGGEIIRSLTDESSNPFTRAAGSSVGLGTNLGVVVGALFTPLAGAIVGAAAGLTSFADQANKIVASLVESQTTFSEAVARARKETADNPISTALGGLATSAGGLARAAGALFTGNLKDIGSAGIRILGGRERGNGVNGEFAQALSLQEFTGQERGSLGLSLGNKLVGDIQKIINKISEESVNPIDIDRAVGIFRQELIESGIVTLEFFTEALSQTDRATPFNVNRLKRAFDFKELIDGVQQSLLAVNASAGLILRQFAINLDRLNAFVTDPSQLTNIILPSDPLELIRRAGADTIKKAGGNAGAINGVADVLGRIVSGLPEFVSFFTDQKSGLERINTLTSILNVGGGEGKKAIINATDPDESGARLRSVADILGPQAARDPAALRRLGIIDQSNKPTSPVALLELIRQFEGVDAGELPKLLQNLGSVTDKLIGNLASEADKVRAFIEIEIKSIQLLDGFNQSIITLEQSIYDLATQITTTSLQFSERNLQVRNTLSGVSPQTAIDNQVGLLRSNVPGASNVGGAGQAVIAAQLELQRIQSRNQSIQAGIGREPGILSKQDLQDEVNARAVLARAQNDLTNASGNASRRLEILSRITDLLVQKFENTKQSFESVGRSLFGRNQNQFANEINAFGSFGAAGGIGAGTSGVGAALDKLNPNTIQDLVSFLESFGSIQLPGGTGQDYLNKIFTSIAVPGIAKVTGRSEADVLKELEAQRQLAEAAQAIEEQSQKDIISLLQVQQQIAQNDIGFFNAQIQRLDTIAQLLGLSNAQDLGQFLSPILDTVKEINNKLTSTGSSVGSSTGSSAAVASPGLDAARKLFYGIPDKPSDSALTTNILNTISRPSSKNLTVPGIQNTPLNFNMTRERAGQKWEQFMGTNPSATREREVAAKYRDMGYDPYENGYRPTPANIPIPNYGYGPTEGINSLIDSGFGPKAHDPGIYDEIKNNGFKNMRRRQNPSDFLRDTNIDAPIKYSLKDKDNNNRIEEYNARNGINKDSSTSNSAGMGVNFGNLDRSITELNDVMRKIYEKMSVTTEGGGGPKFTLSVDPIYVNVNLTAPDILALAGESLYNSVVAAIKPKLRAAFQATGSQEAVSAVEGM